MRHLILPHASAASDAGAAAIATLRLPHLSRLLGRLEPAQTWGDDEYTLNAPHETVLAALKGWTSRDGLHPMAAHLAGIDGAQPQSPTENPTTASDGWGLITPCHWLVGSDQISLVDPAALELDEEASRALLEAVRPSFEAEGWTVTWGAPLRWYARHPLLAELPTASLDRVVGRNLELWLRGLDPQARRVRRLQVEAQMLWHEHPVNEAREARRALAVNSFWLSGTGAPGPATPLPADTRWDEGLRAPLLSDDWAAWCERWQELDAGPVRELLTAAEQGHSVQLTLCGERLAQRFDTPVASGLTGVWQRWRAGSRRAAVGEILNRL